jgi:hypothetical protein
MLGSFFKIIEPVEASGCLVFDAMNSLCDAESAMKNGLFASDLSKFSNVYLWCITRAAVVPA